MNRRSSLLTLVGLSLLAFLMVGCHSFYYTSQIGHLPLMSQKGELVAEAGIAPLTTSLNTTTLEQVGDRQFPDLFNYQASCSYAFADHWASQIALRNGRHQAMVGWFTPLSPNATVEVYGGYAYSRCLTYDDLLADTRGWTNYLQKGNAQSFFLQGDIGFPSYQPNPASKFSLSAGFGLRLGGVLMNYTETDYSSNYVTNNDGERVLVVEETGTTSHAVSLFELQPMLQLGLGGCRLKAEFGIGYSLLIGHDIPNSFPYCTNFCISYRIPLLGAH